MVNYNNFFNDNLKLLKEEGRYRTFADLEKIAGNFPKALNYNDNNVKEVTVWCSNDYLGMSQNKNVLSEMSKAIHKVGAGSGGTRNISGTNHYHVLLERELCYLHQKESALLFNSGYLANQATLSTLGKNLPNCYFLSDEKNHASMIQGIKHSNAKKIIFKHNSVNDLEDKLKKIPTEDSKVIAFESVYSMDGDFSPIKSIVRLAKKYNALTYLDEVHAVGIYGKRGAGVAEKMGVMKDIDILQGTLAKAFGVMGTDELRRDLAIGLLWGTPLALFIGISVSIGSVVVGLIYGVYSGYKGKKTDEVMMRFNDVIYALPALPFLIILAVTISNSIFLMIGFLMIFSWVGIAKVSRSMSLQIKTRQYIEAAKIMGQKDSKIIFRHILPQLLPYAFASIAISVPAAITTEAGLSFLGLGDPSFPTWGQILHDANTYGAAAQGFWWWIVPPGILIAITGLAFVFIGNALDAIVNPKLKR